MGRTVLAARKKASAVVLLTVIFSSSFSILNITMQGKLGVTNQTSNTNDVSTIAPSYADLDRPTLLAAGKYVNYSFSFQPVVPGSIDNVVNTTNITANLYYECNGVVGNSYDMIESIQSYVPVSFQKCEIDGFPPQFKISVGKSVSDHPVPENAPQGARSSQSLVCCSRKH